MNAAIRSAPCRHCLRPVPAGERCELAARHEAERLRVERRCLERRKVAGVWKRLAPHVEARTDLSLRARVAVLIGCGKSKARSSAPAEELYTSPMFRKSLALANEIGDAVFVVSAGRSSLVELTDELEPYDTKLRSFDRETKRSWARGIVSDLARQTMGSPAAVRVVLFMGATYADPIVEELEHLRRSRTWPEPLQPMRGLEVGERLSFLNRALTAIARGELLDGLERRDRKLGAWQRETLEEVVATTKRRLSFVPPRTDRELAVLRRLESLGLVAEIEVVGGYVATEKGIALVEAGV